MQIQTGINIISKNEVLIINVPTLRRLRLSRADLENMEEGFGGVGGGVVWHMIFSTIERKGEGQKDIYRIAAARDRAGKDIGQMRTIKSATEDVLMRNEDIRERWGQYFSWLMNEENPRVETEEREPNQGLTAPINEAETERALKGMKSGKAGGSDKIPAEV